MDNTLLGLENRFEAAMNTFLEAKEPGEASTAYRHLLEAFEALKAFEMEESLEEAS